MARKEEYFVAKLDMTVAGKRVNKGQLIQPTGSPNDHKIYGDDTHWTHRWDGSEPEVCGTDGCGLKFAHLGSLNRHRKIVHGPERDARERGRIEQAKAKLDREMQPGEEVVPGETTIRGHVVSKVRHGPGGPVPYIEAPTG